MTKPHVEPRLQSFHLSFCSDLTRANAPTIPLGYLMEATWSDDARWLGLVGRSEIESYERELVNLHNWPELQDPNTLFAQAFECGWDSDWGCAATAVSEKWRASALIIEGASSATLPEFGDINDDVIWEKARAWLNQTLNTYTTMLKPLVKPRPAPSPVRRIPHETRSREGFKLAA